MKSDLRSTEFRKLVALGESVTAGGWSTSRERCWASRLKVLIDDFQSRPVELFNAGVGSNVISTLSTPYAHSGKPSAEERLNRHVIEQAPDLLIVAYGLNDAAGGTPVQLFRTRLESLVQRVRAALDPLIVLVGPNFVIDYAYGPPIWNHATPETLAVYNEAIAEVAREQRILYVDLLAAFKEAEWMIHFDAIHPNDLGHQLIANRIFEVLAQNCSCLARRTQELEKTSPRWRDETALQTGFDTSTPQGQQ